MARPVKNYCDYFPHDRDMRNHRKVKAIRTKFGITGYAIWVMFLEYLTGSDGNVFEFSDVEVELISGDFGVSATEMSDVLNYCIKMELLFQKEGFIHSESLDERLSGVYEKRKQSKEQSKKQQRINGKFIRNNTVDNGVSVTEMPQIKLNEIKLKENNINNGTWESEKILFLNAEQWQMKQCGEFSITKDVLLVSITEFLKELELKEDFKDQKELKRHWYNWYKSNLNKKPQRRQLSEYEIKLEQQREAAKKRTA